MYDALLNVSEVSVKNLRYSKPPSNTSFSAFFPFKTFGATKHTRILTQSFPNFPISLNITLSRNDLFVNPGPRTSPFLSQSFDPQRLQRLSLPKFTLLRPAWRLVSRMAFYVSPGPLCDCCKYCTIPRRTFSYHSDQFKAISTSPVTGITFKAYEYSATQLADAFEKLIPGHMDFEIKQQALARWNVLVPELLDGPLWRDTEFDLKDSFAVLDDFLFMRALQDRCRVEWVDESHKGWKRATVGWCEPAESTNREPIQWIRIVRPTVDKPRTVWDCLCTLMHEMCHSIFAFKCNCLLCRCLLNRMNGEGLDGHGPSWEKLRRCIERTANLHLEGFSEPIVLCYSNEPQVGTEIKKNAAKLGGLYKKITHQGNQSAELKRAERAKKWAEKTEVLAEIEKEQTEKKQLETLACAGAMFKDFERERVLGGLDKCVTSARAMIENARREEQSPELMRALDYIQTMILKAHKDDVCVAHNIGSHESEGHGGEGPEEGKSA